MDNGGDIAMDNLWPSNVAGRVNLPSQTALVSQAYYKFITVAGSTLGKAVNRT